ncbi:MADS-box transcription factor 14-like isoform X2 [Carya illinoinensis]|uniref:MADS-box transcription factor 14-like isoform X2 n=1 Tax=Carya illinoinensis TaxID=32201 RepID=UPI001C71FB77|nr:MADS-box transcription factor 14-like isoform X2 [Carya illinoinensis]
MQSTKELPRIRSPWLVKKSNYLQAYSASFWCHLSIGKILERYRIHVEEEIAVRQSAEKGKRYDAGFPDQQMDTSPQQKIQRYIEEQNIEEKNIIELTQLEKELDMILRQTRFKKTQLMMEAVKALQDEQQNLRREKTQVEEEMAAMKSDQNLNDNHHSHALELESNPHANDYTPHFQEAMLHLF